VVRGVEINTPFADAALALAGDVARAWQRPIALDVLRCNILDLDESAPYDVITMKEAFHHLEPRAEMVRKIGRLLAPGGLLAVLEPNAWNVLLQWRLFRIRGFNTIVTKTDPASGETFTYGNERVVTGGRMSRLFAAEGIHVRPTYHRFVPTPLVGRLPDGLVRRGEAVLERGLPQLAAIHCTWVGRKRQVAR
jgi:SAM-dependent methyltransferase